MEKSTKSDKRKTPYNLLNTAKENRRCNMVLLMIKEPNGGIPTTKTFTERDNIRENPGITSNFQSYGNPKQLKIFGKTSP